MPGLAVIGLVISWALIAAGPKAKAKAFIESSRTPLWHALLAAQPVLWLGTLCAVGQLPHKSLWPFVTQMPVILGAVAVFGASLVPVVASSLMPYTSKFDEKTGLPGFRYKMVIVSVLGILVATVHAWGLLAVYQRAVTAVTASPLPGATECRKLRQLAETLVACAGAIVAVGIVSTSELRKLVLAKDPHANFPKEAVLAYGLWFTTLLALVYVPASTAMTTLGEKVVDSLRPFPLPTDLNVDLKAWDEQRQVLGRYLGLDRTTGEVMQAAFAVLAPVLASLSSYAGGQKESEAAGSEE